QERFGNADQLFDELLGLWAKSKINPLRSAKQIRNDRKAASLHSLKQQRRATSFNYAAMYFSKLEIRIDFGIDRNEIIFTAQALEEGTKVTVHSVVSSVPVDLCLCGNQSFHHRDAEIHRATERG